MIGRILFALSLSVSTVLVGGVGREALLDTNMTMWKTTARKLVDELTNWRYENGSGVDSLLAPESLRSLAPGNISACLDALNRISEEGGSKWYTILDASGKPPAGILEGNLAWFGNFRQCEDVEDLHYCTVSTERQRTVPSFSLDLCYPIECTSRDITNIVDSLIKEIIHRLPDGDLEELNTHCSTKYDAGTDGGFIATMVILSSICVLMLCATICDNYLTWRESSRMQHNSESTDEERHPILSEKTLINNKENCREYSIGMRMLLCFSLDRCIPHIMKTSQGADDITCLHGMRVVSMFWIILGHMFSFLQKSNAMGSPLWVYSVPAKWFTSQAVLNAYPALNTFFLMGGLLTTYTKLRYSAKSSRRMKWYKVVILRYLRITPALVMLILLYTFVFPYLGEGPLWDKSVQDTLACHDNWWTNLLYINNFVPENVSAQGCVSWTWYLAADMQLFIISIPVLILLDWSSLAGVMAISVLVASGVAVRAAMFAIDNFPAGQIINVVTGGPAESSMFAFNAKPYACAVPYFVGVLVGYFLFRRRKSRKLNLHPVVIIVGWASAFALGMAVVYGLYSVFNMPGMEFAALSKAENVLYGSLNGLAWSVAISWVILACHLGYGGVINKFLSWKLWIPLSRLTFCAYLLHPLVIYLYTGTITTIFHFTLVHQSILFAGFVTISYAVAFLMSALVEVPICMLCGLAAPKR